MARESHTRSVTKFLDFLRVIFDITIDALLTQIIICSALISNLATRRSIV